jgi:hypothetical protein
MGSLAQSPTEYLTSGQEIDYADLLDRVEASIGLNVEAVPVGANHGCQVGRRFVNIDSLLHTFNVYRLRQLGASSETEIAEIGGGYGCLAELCHRASLRRFTIYDLPWVNVLQGYFLIMALPPGAVCLHGEDEGSVAVRPYWTFHELPDRSQDFIVNINSLPEMGASTAREYVNTFARVLRQVFLSVNQEGAATTVAGERQLVVGQLVGEQGGLECRSRCRWWMEEGYVEEVFAPRE